jgi:hypothetical protein
MRLGLTSSFQLRNRLAGAALPPVRSGTSGAAQPAAALPGLLQLSATIKRHAARQKRSVALAVARFVGYVHDTLM